MFDEANNSLANYLWELVNFMLGNPQNKWIYWLNPFIDSTWHVCVWAMVGLRELG